MDIMFDFKGDPVGGKLVNYLLEKVIYTIIYYRLNKNLIPFQ